MLSTTLETNAGMCYTHPQEVREMEMSMAEFDIKVLLRNERDVLLAIKRVTPDDAKEAIRLINQRLGTIKESLES